MTNEAIKSDITERYPTAIFDEATEWLTVNIDPLIYKDLVSDLRSADSLDLDYLFCQTCIDWKTHFTVVLHLTSTTKRHSLVIKIKLDKADPVIDTVSDIYRTAEFHEREIYDLFGIKFSGHPDLRRLFMTDDWKGWPLRKDYEDAVNMIRL